MYIGKGQLCFFFIRLRVISRKACLKALTPRHLRKLKSCGTVFHRSRTDEGLAPKENICAFTLTP